MQLSCAICWVLTLRDARFPIFGRRQLVGSYFDSMNEWLEQGKIVLPKVTVYQMDEVAETHELIQSGRSVGKIVVATNAN